MGTTEPTLMSTRDAAQFLGWSEEYVRRLARDKRIPAVKVGRRQWRFWQHELQEWITCGCPSRSEGTSPIVDTAESGWSISERAVRYRLSPVGHGTQARLPLNGANQMFSAPAFSENSEEPFHRWVNWIAGFSASFVRECIGEFMPTGRGLIVDPFAGVATSLLEAMVAGHHAVGFEINPFAALVGRTKLAAFGMEADAIQDLALRFERWMRDALKANTPPRALPPAGFRSRIPFFSPAIANQVLLVMDFMGELTDSCSSDLMKIALGSTMVSFSNYTYEPSLGTRPGAGKPLIADADVCGVIAAKLSQMASDVRRLGSSRRKAGGQGVIHPESFFGCLETGKLAPSSVDLLITSPPYPNNYHYVRNTRPHLYWLGLVRSQGQLLDLELQSYGRFWQTVRTSRPIGLAFELPEAASLVDRIRGQNHERGPYGGPGWANYVACYLNDSWRFVSLIHALLKPGRTAAVVVGNHIIQGVNFEVDKMLATMGERFGLVSRIHLLRDKRVGNSITNSSVRRGAAAVSIYESAVEMTKSSS